MSYVMIAAGVVLVILPGVVQAGFLRINKDGPFAGVYAGRGARIGLMCLGAAMIAFALLVGTQSA